MMRSSPIGRADSATQTSPAARTVVTALPRVNSGLTKLSTKADPFFRRYRYPDWRETHSRVVGAIAEALVAARRRGAPPIDAESVVVAAYLHDIGRSPLLAGDPRDHHIPSGLALAARRLGGRVILWAAGSLPRGRSCGATRRPTSTPASPAKAK